MNRDPDRRLATLLTAPPRTRLQKLCTGPYAPSHTPRALSIAETIIEYTVLDIVFFLTWFVLAVSERTLRFFTTFHISAFDIFDTIGGWLNSAAKKDKFPRSVMLVGMTAAFVCVPSCTVLILMFFVACMQGVQIKELEAQREVLRARLAGKGTWPVEEEWDVIGQMD